MFFAFGRIIFIFIITILCLALAVFVLRTFGLNTTITQLNHPLLLQTPWVIAKGGDLSAGPSQSLPALQAAANYNSPHILLGLHIRLTNDGKWVLYEPTQLSELTTGKGFVNQLTLDELKKINFKNSTEKLIALDEVFEKIPRTQYHIEILQPANGHLDTVYDLIKKYKLEDKVVLTSPFADTLREVREKNGAWLTGASTIELSKTRFMTSLFLESSVDLPADVFAVPEDANPRLITELTRRKKILLFTEGAAGVASKEFHKFSEQPHRAQIAIMTTHPNNYRQFVDRPVGTN